MDADVAPRQAFLLGVVAALCGPTVTASELTASVTAGDEGAGPLWSWEAGQSAAAA